MAIYKYSGDSLIDEIEILTNEKGGSRAYLHARSSNTPEAFRAIHETFNDKGWLGVPYQRNGRAVLELRGFKKPEELLSVLSAQGFVQTEAAIEKSKDDAQSKADQFRANTLKASGWAYMLGDWSFMAYAVMELFGYRKKKAGVDAAQAAVKSIDRGTSLSDEVKISTLSAQHPIINDLSKSYGITGNLAELSKEIDASAAAAKASVSGGKAKIYSGVGYGLGSIFLAAYGSRDQSAIEIKKTTKSIERFIKNEGLRDPNQETILRQQPEKKNQSILDRVDGLLKRYPSEATNLVFTATGLFLMRSSFKQINASKQHIASAEQRLAITAKNSPAHDTLSKLIKSHKDDKNIEWIDVGLGTITASASMAGILIKEKKPLEGEKKREGLPGLWDSIQEKPLRVTGIGLMIATGVHAVATYFKWQKGEYTHKVLYGRIGFIVSNIIAETLLLLSSKGHGEGVRNADVDETVIASTAEFVAKQNPATQEQLIQRLAGYMSAPDVLGMKAEEIATELRAQVASLSSNPWAYTHRHASSVQQAAVVDPAPIQPSLVQMDKPSTSVQAIQRDGAIKEKQIASAIH